MRVKKFLLFNSVVEFLKNIEKFFISAMFINMGMFYFFTHPDTVSTFIFVIVQITCVLASFAVMNTVKLYAQYILKENSQ